MLSDILQNQNLKEDIYIPRNKNELNEVKKKIKDQTIAEMEKKFIVEALRQSNWNVSKAARETGFHRTNFHALMRKYDIKVSSK